MSCIRENDLAVAVRGIIFGLLPVAMELMQPTVNAASHHVEVFTMYFILRDFTGYGIDQTNCCAHDVATKTTLLFHR